MTLASNKFLCYQPFFNGKFPPYSYLTSALKSIKKPPVAAFEDIESGAATVSVFDASKPSLGCFQNTFKIMSNCREKNSS